MYKNEKNFLETYLPTNGEMWQKLNATWTHLVGLVSFEGCYLERLPINSYAELICCIVNFAGNKGMIYIRKIYTYSSSWEMSHHRSENWHSIVPKYILLPLETRSVHTCAHKLI